MSHLRLLTEMIRGLMTENLIGPEDISAIACSAGPGSFTGIRIGVTTARTIAQVWDKPCISVSSLEVFAQRCGEENDVAAIFNARRGQVYGALFSAGSGVMLKPGPYMLGDVIETAESAEAAKSPVRVRWYGDGTDAYASDLEGFDIAPREERYQTAFYKKLSVLSSCKPSISFSIHLSFLDLKIIKESKSSLIYFETSYFNL